MEVDLEGLPIGEDAPNVVNVIIQRFAVILHHTLS